MCANYASSSNQQEYGNQSCLKNKILLLMFNNFSIVFCGAIILVSISGIPRLTGLGNVLGLFLTKVVCHRQCLQKPMQKF